MIFYNFLEEWIYCAGANEQVAAWETFTDYEGRVIFSIYIHSVNWKILEK
jgi:hypothetical protein